MYCTNCGKEIDGMTSFCVNCGAPTSNKKTCLNCGAELADGVAFCQNCGTATTGGAPEVKPQQGRKSKLAVGLLAILLGTYGLHHFYLGNSNKGLMQLLISLAGGLVTCGISTLVVYVWAFVEGIFFLMGKEGYTTDANGVPLGE